MASDAQFVRIGKFGRPRGLRGDIYITPDTDFPERLLKLKELQVREGNEWKVMRITKAQEVSGRPVVHVQGVETPEQASRLTNRAIAIPMEALPKLDDGRHYVHDIIGCTVIETTSGETLGEITDIERYPANDVYVIRTTGGHEVLFPAVKDFVREIDIEAKKIRIVHAGLFEGLDSSGGNEV